MSGNREVTYAVDFCAGKKGGKGAALALDQQSRSERSDASIPRIARLMALAIRFEGLLREGRIRDYAELARLGCVTRARMTQIMKLRYLAPDIQERILFLPPVNGLNERNLRPVVSRIGWEEQRRLFEKIAAGRRMTAEAERRLS